MYIILLTLAMDRIFVGNERFVGKYNATLITSVTSATATGASMAMINKVIDIHAISGCSNERSIVHSVLYMTDNKYMSPLTNKQVYVEKFIQTLRKAGSLLDMMKEWTLKVLGKTILIIDDIDDMDGVLYDSDYIILYKNKMGYSPIRT